MKHGGVNWEQAIVALIVVTICLSNLQDVLPPLVPSLVVVAVLAVVLRFAFGRRDGW